MAKKKPKSKTKSKVRTDFRKNHQGRARDGDLTREFKQHGFEDQDTLRDERLSGKGELTRKRTIMGVDETNDESGLSVTLEVESSCLRGRVLSVHGLSSHVQAEDGRLFACATRGLLKSLSTDQRNVVAAGDRVMFRAEGERDGMIERIEPRTGVISRTSRGRQHVIVANVDLLVIVSSAAEPTLKPNLIDRFLVTGEKSGINTLVCINKSDLVDPADLQPLLGVYAQMGHQTLLVSAETGDGCENLRHALQDKESVVVGQSGVGKSSLLNTIDDQLQLRVGHISTDNQKGRHTTTAARLLPWSFGGYIVDTPGIRQFELWDVIAEEIPGFFRDLRPYVSLCRFPDCTHTHEDNCAVKNAVADGRLDVRRYESYCHMRG